MIVSLLSFFLLLSYVSSNQTDGKNLEYTLGLMRNDEKTPFCSATIIDEYFAISAASCFYSNDKSSTATLTYQPSFRKDMEKVYGFTGASSNQVKHKYDIQYVAVNKGYEYSLKEKEIFSTTLNDEKNKHLNTFKNDIAVVYFQNSLINNSFEHNGSQFVTRALSIVPYFLNLKKHSMAMKLIRSKFEEGYPVFTKSTAKSLLDNQHNFDVTISGFDDTSNRFSRAVIVPRIKTNSEEEKKCIKEVLFAFARDSGFQLAKGEIGSGAVLEMDGCEFLVGVFNWQETDGVKMLGFSDIARHYFWIRSVILEFREEEVKKQDDINTDDIFYYDQEDDINTDDIFYYDPLFVHELGDLWSTNFGDPMLQVSTIKGKVEKCDATFKSTNKFNLFKRIYNSIPTSLVKNIRNIFHSPGKRSYARTF